MTQFEWLSSLCDPLLKNQARAFLLQWRGGAWTCASNGQCVTLVRATLTDERGASDIVGALPGMLDAGMLGEDCISWERLAAFLADATASKEVICPMCRNVVGKRICLSCDGDGATECDSCGHESSCDICKGTGSICCNTCRLLQSTPIAKPGMISGEVCIDRNLLKRFLGDLRADNVLISYGEMLDPVLVEPARDADWAVLLMPFRRELTDKVATL